MMIKSVYLNTKLLCYSHVMVITIMTLHLLAPQKYFSIFSPLSCVAIETKG